MTSWGWLGGRLRAGLIEIEARFCHRGRPPGMRRCQRAVEPIMGYLDDTLAPAEQRAFEAHIADRLGRPMGNRRGTPALPRPTWGASTAKESLLCRRCYGRKPR